MFLIISSSLHPTSRSRILARAAQAHFADAGHQTQLFDLAVDSLPPCDGATAYGHENVQRLAGLIGNAKAITIASPVYNYDVNAAIKNAVELTGKSWTGKVVSMLLAAGGQGSYMSAMGLANSLMLDFRCLIVPRFVYATGDAFEGNDLADEDIAGRVQRVVQETMHLADAIEKAPRSHTS
ncbi:MAG: NAD(P)H-dependent oxidoreductase [Planctomycetota bacterium]